MHACIPEWYEENERLAPDGRLSRSRAADASGARRSRRFSVRTSHRIRARPETPR